MLHRRNLAVEPPDEFAEDHRHLRVVAEGGKHHVALGAGISGMRREGRHRRCRRVDRVGSSSAATALMRRRGAIGPRLLADVGGHRPNQPRAIDRLGQVFVAAGFLAPFTIVGHGVCSQGEDRPGVAAAAEQAGRLVAVHVRHVHVHQDDIECSCLGFGDRAVDHLRRI